jgi:hypothetical protein
MEVYPDNKTKRNHWYMYVSAFIRENAKNKNDPPCFPNGPFVGHCCELLFCKRRLNESPPTATRYDGCLFLPEYKILLSPCFGRDGMVDIHGFGGMAPYFSGVVHCVPSLASCVEYEKGGIVATGSGSMFQQLEQNPMVREYKIPYEQKKGSNPIKRKVNNEPKADCPFDN